ncbi:hypothetical protein PMZ80_000711 [Knufia obscura]|uniref:D-arabinitol 2-dehydrogenase [ribulose-forming] n=2 Tax=Knufia TaxID=430999 RepID=A0AAN8E9I0_9EURO|nr:hypothetical protein PMZ80_000711 [Knufia obscura]KAK5949083.1 hypothetical protein OHC33_009824 [Knufia fluminis]
MAQDGQRNGQPVAPMANPEDRAALASRTLPQMTLSTAESPLTAPLPPPQASTPAERATARFRIDGNAVITGGSGTLAYAATRALIEHGLSQVTLMDLQPSIDAAKEKMAELNRDFPHVKVHVVTVDVTDQEVAEEAFQKASEIMGGIDILCCFAGIVGCVHSTEQTAKEWRKVLDVNLTGSFVCAQAAAKHMIASQNGGSILFTASISAHHVNYPQPQAAYNVSKIGVTHLTRNLAAEWAVHGIRVNCISPGYLDTVLNAGDNLKDVRTVWASRCPMGRMGDVDEITPSVVLLSSKRAGRYITGTDLVVDGGAMCF